MALLQNAHAAFAEAPARLAHSLCLFSPQPPLGKPGAASTTWRSETAAATTAICRSRQTVLGDLAAALAGMETGIDPRATGNRRSLALRRVQAVLDVAFAASDPRGKKVHKQGVASPYLPHGC